MNIILPVLLFTLMFPGFKDIIYCSSRSKLTKGKNTFCAFAGDIDVHSVLGFSLHTAQLVYQFYFETAKCFCLNLTS